jgi:hypothetical protein
MKTALKLIELRTRQDINKARYQALRAELAAEGTLTQQLRDETKRVVMEVITRAIDVLAPDLRGQYTQFDISHAQPLDKSVNVHVSFWRERATRAGEYSSTGLVRDYLEQRRYNLPYEFFDMPQEELRDFFIAQIRKGKKWAMDASTEIEALL